MSTTFPLRDLLLSGGELSQATAPLKSGMGPSSLSTGSVSAAPAAKSLCEKILDERVFNTPAVSLGAGTVNHTFDAQPAYIAGFRSRNSTCA